MELPKIRYALDRIRPAGGTIPTHIHPTWELVYYIDGSGKTVIGNICYDYTPGSLCLIPPETDHSELNTEQTHVIFCTFMPSSEFRCISGLYLGNEELAYLVQMLASPAAGDSGPEAKIAELCLSIMLLRLVSQQSIVGTIMRTDSRSLDRALQFISDYYNTDIKLPTLATMVGYSYDRFRHLFRLQYGISPKQMILQRRIDAAKELLRREGSITNIARDCGFPSISQFTTCFKNATGMTPREYRNKNRAQK